MKAEPFVSVLTVFPVSQYAPQTLSWSLFGL
jgi:hypothetical protein